MASASPRQPPPQHGHHNSHHQQRHDATPTSTTPFSFADTCPWIISMPHSYTSRVATVAQLIAQGLAAGPPPANPNTAAAAVGSSSSTSSNIRHPPRIWPGLPLRQQPELLEPAIQEAHGACLVPDSYAAAGAAATHNHNHSTTTRWHGTIGSTLAHLQLLRHLWVRRKHLGCTWAFVMADDTLLLPGFKTWAEQHIAAAGPSFDFLNLGVVRGWGDLISGSTTATKRVPADPSTRLKVWDSALPIVGIKSPNILVSAYIVRLSSLPTLLSGFAGVQTLGRRCSIDQVLARLEYALATTKPSGGGGGGGGSSDGGGSGSRSYYASYNIDITRSRVGHCAVGVDEAATFAKLFPERHEGCTTWHKPIYGNGSRSHDRRRRLQEAPPSLKHANNRVWSDPGCSHSFHVPGDRVMVAPRPEKADGSVGLVTKPQLDAADMAELDGLASDAWKACASAPLADGGPYAKYEREVMRSSE